MILILTIAKFVLLFLFGFSVINLLKFRGGKLEKTGLSFLLGTGLTSVIYFLYIWGVYRVFSTDFWIITFFLTTLLIALGKPTISLRKIKLPKIDVKSNLVVIFCWLVILLLFFASIIVTSYTPVHNPDSLYLFDFRAKVLFISGKLTNITQVRGWDAYPMFTSMIGLMWRFMGIENPSSYYPVMYLSFAFIFYSTLRKVVNKNLASIGTLFMYTTPITFWQSQLDGMTNIPYTIFLCLSILYIFKIMKSRKFFYSDVIIPSIFLGLSSWTRGVEPLWLIPLFLLSLVLVVKNKIWWVFIYFSIFSFIREIWPLFIKQRYITIERGIDAIVSNAAASSAGAVTLAQSATYTFNSMLHLLPSSLGPVWYLFVAVLFLNIISRKFTSDQIYYLFSVAGILVIIFFGSLFMVISFQMVIDVYNDSLSRLLGILPPLLWFYIMINPAWLSVESVFKWGKGRRQ